MSWSGTPHKKILALHQRYGGVVRTSPNSVSCLHASAWKEVYGHRKPGQPENLKHPGFVTEVAAGIIGADTKEHTHQRHLLAPAFSAQGMQRQEPLIRHHVNNLFRCFEEHCAADRPIDLGQYFNFFSFDVIGDLSFGESFGNLDRGAFHPWIATILDFFVAQHDMAHFRRAYPFLEALVGPLIKVFAAKIILKHNTFMRTQITKRLALEPSRPDFVDGMMPDAAKGKEGLSLEAICHNASIFVVAGSETTALALAGAIYLICTHPEVLTRLKEEIDSSFSSEEQITLLSAQRLKYLTAVIDETLRLYPAAVGSVPRLIQPAGQVIGGYFLPGGTCVDIWHWSMYHNPANFSEPEVFAPQRWLGDERFGADKKAAFQPFSTGKRSCIGMYLAHSEIKQIVARLLWKYEVELVEGVWRERDWCDQRVRASYVHPPLRVRLAVRRGKGEVG
ncbi:cytochrome p450 [Pyrenophora seminiperda CCB06]|uniref:Cytochrome p450 n=1 Tax=Pyrenophora seminiperda CCB06 TaxID=1302712 RepID=A0A3M7M8E5_9PLEO|nr:cytochrome p450 [Pyrenophora seminiperda CCB06]